jgi:hypothetical protein
MAIMRTTYMQLQYSLTWRDYKAAQTLHAKRGAIAYLVHCVAYFLWPMLGICFLVFEFTPHHIGAMPQPKFLTTLSGFVLLGCPLFLRWTMKRSYKRTRSGTGDCTIDLDQEMIRTRGLHTKSEMEWTAIQ